MEGFATAADIIIDERTARPAALNQLSHFTDPEQDNGLNRRVFEQGMVMDHPQTRAVGRALHCTAAATWLR